MGGRLDPDCLTFFSDYANRRVYVQGRRGWVRPTRRAAKHEMPTHYILDRYLGGLHTVEGIA